MKLDPARVFVTVVDENAYVVDMVEKLCPFASLIRVITSCEREYSCLAEKLLGKYGLSMLIGAKADADILDSTVIISPFSIPVPLTYRGILFTNEKRRMMNAVVLSGGGKITLPEKYQKLLPESVDPLCFASALYELCAVDELGTLEFDRME